MPASLDSSCTIAIGPLAVALRCTDEALAEQLRQRYHDFLAPATPHLTVQIATDFQPQPPASGLQGGAASGAERSPASCLLPPASGAERPPGLVLRGPLAEIAYPGVAARVELDAGHAELRAEPARALHAVDDLLRVVVAMLAFAAGGILVHAAGLACGRRGYLFLGPSGAGKTTVARLSPGARVLNDDLVLLLPAGAGWVLVATPFSNPTQVAPAGPGQADLSALLYLVQAPRVARLPMSLAAATAALAARAPLVGCDPARGGALLRRARAISAAVPSSWLHFLPEPDFWAVIEPAS